MTVYEDEIPARRPGVGAKVLGLACAILAILAAFWGIVWFIRSYVEPPRVMMPAALQLVSRDSIPIPAAKIAVDRRTEEAKPAVEPPAPAPPSVQAVTPALQLPPPGPSLAEQSSAGSVADRWGPMNQFPQPAVAPTPQPAPVVSAPAAAESTSPLLATGAPERDADEVAEGFVPAIDGPAPLPRRRPVMTAQRRSNDPPLPRPRPDGQVAPAPSVFIAVPTTDDRYPGQ